MGVTCWILVLMIPQVFIYSVAESGIIVNIGAIFTSETDGIVLGAAERFMYRAVKSGVTVNLTHLQLSSRDGETTLLSTLQKVCGLLKSGIHGIVAHVSCSNIHLLSSLLEPLGLPTVLISKPVSCIIDSIGHGLHNGSSVLLMNPDFSVVHQALDDVYKDSYQYVTTHRVVVFYDQFTDPRYIMNLMNYGNQTAFAPIFIHEDNVHFPQLEHLNSSDQIFVLFCEETVTKNLLKKASVLGFNTSFYIWIAVFTDMSRNLVDYNHWTQGNLLTLHSCYLPISQRACPIDVSHLLNELPHGLTLGQAYFLDGAVMLAEAFISLKQDQNFSLSSPPVFDCSLPYDQCWEGGNTVIHHISEIQSVFKGILGPTHLLPELLSEGLAEAAELDLWAVDPRGEDGASLRGTWTLEKGLQKNTPNVVVNPVNNFQNRTLVIGIVQSDPFVKINPDDPSSKPTGFCIDIVDVLSNCLNFSIKYIHSNVEDYGNLNRSIGKWSGLIGRVISKEIDMAVGPFTVTRDRGDAAELTVPFMEGTYGILVKRPGKDSKMDRVFLPFHYTTWCAIAIAIVVVGCLLFCVRCCLHDNEEEEGEECGDPSRITLKAVISRFADDLWVSYGSYLEQSTENYPRSPSGRMLVVFWWLFTIIMSATYTANLVAFLTVTKVVKHIENLEELADDPNIYPIILPGQVLSELFMESDPSSTYGKVWAKLKKAPDPMPPNVSEAIKMVETGQYALLTDTGIIANYANKDCEKFVQARQEFNPAGLAFVLEKNSPKKSLIDQYLVQMQESGLMQKWRALWWPANGGSCGKDQPWATPWSHLGLESLAGAFLVVAVAIGVALLLLAFELLIAQASKKAEWAVTAGQRESDSVGSSEQTYDIQMGGS